MHDPRQPRTLRARTLSALVIDSSGFSRTLIGDILRSLDVGDVASARTEEEATTHLAGRPCDLVLISWEEGDALDGLGLSRRLRRVHFDRLRRIPILFVTSALTRQLVIDGRDAGVDEFLAKPISPLAMRQRLEMVVETPRPFVDCSVYLGPCRRRKNPADYHGAKRRTGDRTEEPSKPMIDHDEEAAKSPIRLALAALRGACAEFQAGKTEALTDMMRNVAASKAIAVADKDHALHSSIAAFEAYVAVASPARQLEEHVLQTALGALEQLSVLPPSYTEARDSVAIALGKAIQKKLAA